ncbi:MAG: hypothetical protein ACR2N5_04790 [Solirubrobacterales bacterium]
MHDQDEIAAAFQAGARFQVLTDPPADARTLLLVDAEGFPHLHRPPLARRKDSRAVALVGGTVAAH